MRPVCPTVDLGDRCDYCCEDGKSPMYPQAHRVTSWYRWPVPANNGLNNPNRVELLSLTTTPAHSQIPEFSCSLSGARGSENSIDSSWLPGTDYHRVSRAATGMHFELE